MKKYLGKTIFWQDWGAFYGNIMVCVNWKDYAELIEHLKKIGYKTEAAALKNKQDHISSNHFSKYFYKDILYQILFLKDWKDDERHKEILSHELIHAVMFCMPEFLDMFDEKEAVAYTHGYLFRAISRKLNGVTKIV